MDPSLRELGERKVGTQDFNPRIALPRFDHARVADAEPEAASAEEHCASLYDAIRDMSSYGSARQAEKRVCDGDGHLRGP
ncbi:hypothetical protein [Streptomyces bullii]|uniref:Uncharacterized protein n=1 Tax=Streptomyces bullii TaxID=349910 RepID=A0ABW0US06_9ACTN